VAHTSRISRIRHRGQGLQQARHLGTAEQHQRRTVGKLANHLADQR
jgi:hypothetical protein